MPTRQNKMVLTFVAMLLPVMLLTHSAAGQEESSTESWEFQFTPYLWMSDVKGNTTLKGRTGSTDASFSDILDSLDFGLMGRVEAWKGKWGLFFDGLYIDLGSEYSTPRGLISADIDIKEMFFDFGIGYRLWETQLNEETDQSLSFDLLGGGRYVRLEGEVDITPNGPLADIGGFGIGSASDLTWNLVAGIDYKLTKNLSLKAGYRIMDINYERGSGSNKFGLDIQMKGPVLGCTLRF